MTRDDVRGIIEGITDDQLKRILDINSADIGKVKADLDKVKGDLDTANNKIADYEKEIGTLKESIGNTEEMQKKIDTLQASIDERKAADEAAALEAAMVNRFNAVCGDAKFLNEFTKNGLFDEFKTALADEANKTKSDKDIYEAITDGKDNIFMPDGGIPGVASSTGGDPAVNDNDIREIMGLPPLK
jgi:DNA repair exonuclease SbcCD ATPase subunit